jgi:FtsP/CotA-like multicopper oxidase with cupredoxin domain
LDLSERADGHPRLAVGSGREYLYEFEVTNRAGTYWYHPHPHMRTGPQVYAGLAGLLLVGDDEEDALGLPSGEHEILCVLQDRRVDVRNQFVYTGGGMMTAMHGMLGDRMLVNGESEPTRDVDAGWHRVRLLNASNARIYKLAWSHGRPMTVIGSDGGLLERPVVHGFLTLAPGQRADVLLDLTGLASGTEVHLDSLEFPEADAGIAGMMSRSSSVRNGAPLRLMTLRPRARAGATFTTPLRLSEFEPSWRPSSTVRPRRVSLGFQRMQWRLGDRTFAMDDVASDETVAAGSTHVWEFVNERAGMGMGMGMGMEMAHPIHLHGRQFRVLDRAPSRRTNALREGIVDGGWTDTVLVLPGETVRVEVTFSRHPGLYLYHCHILEHEDMGMMRNFRVT